MKLCIFFCCGRFLRIDTLSLLLSFANISAYSDVLLVDMVGGLLTGSVAERLGGIFLLLVFDNIFYLIKLMLIYIVNVV